MKIIEVTKHPFQMYFDADPVDGGQIEAIEPTAETILTGAVNTVGEVKQFIASIRKTFADGKVEMHEVLLVYKEGKEAVQEIKKNIPAFKRIIQATGQFFKDAAKAVSSLFKRKK